MREHSCATRIFIVIAIVFFAIYISFRISANLVFLNLEYVRNLDAFVARAFTKNSHIGCPSQIFNFR